MRRYALRDDQWERIGGLLPGREGHVGVTAKDDRALVDALGNPTGFALSPGRAHDREGADALPPDLAADAPIAGEAFDAGERVLRPLARAGKAAVIPPEASRRNPRPYDRDLYEAPPDRELLRQAEAVPGHRDPPRVWLRNV